MCAPLAPGSRRPCGLCTRRTVPPNSLWTPRRAQAALVGCAGRRCAEQRAVGTPRRTGSLAADSGGTSCSARSSASRAGTDPRWSRTCPPADRSKRAQAAYELGNGTHLTAADSAPLALWIAATFLDAYRSAVVACLQARGDMDTIAAMAGIVATCNGGRPTTGSVPEDWLAAREALPGRGEPQSVIAPANRTYRPPRFGIPSGRDDVETQRVFRNTVEVPFNTECVGIG